MIRGITMVSRGMFVTFEGGEGCGKTTQIGLLTDYLGEQGYSVVRTREPGGTNCRLAEKVRAMLLDPEHAEMSNKTEILLFCAARAQHIQEVIAPALAKGQVVLCDRYFDATWVYQSYTRGVISNDEFWKLNRYTVTYDEWAFIPDLTFHLDIPVEIGHQRALQRNKRADDHSEARFDNEALAFHTKVNEGYRQLAMQWPRIRTVDANRTIDEIQADLRKIFTENVTHSYKKLEFRQPLQTVQEFSA